MESNSFKLLSERIEGELTPLSHAQRLAFAAACCERALPNYVAFSRAAHWGDSAILRTSLDFVWRFIEGAEFLPDESILLEQRCESVTPDLDDFPDPSVDVLAAAGQEAAFMTRLLLQFHRENQLTYALRISTFARDTIDMYVQVLEELDPADPQLDNKIARHPLALRETEKQERDLRALTGVTSPSDLVQFRKSASRPIWSNVGVTTNSNS